MWTEVTRPKYERTGQRYASDLTDREWAVIGGGTEAHFINRLFGLYA